MKQGHLSPSNIGAIPPSTSEVLRKDQGVDPLTVPAAYCYRRSSVVYLSVKGVFHCAEDRD